MEDLLREFVTETNESLDVVDNELVRFEQEPSNKQILDRVVEAYRKLRNTSRRPSARFRKTDAVGCPWYA